MASRRSSVAHTRPGKSLSRSMRLPNSSMRRSFGSVRLISANSASASAGVAMMSLISVLQKTMLPAPIIAIFIRGSSRSIIICFPKSAKAAERGAKRKRELGGLAARSERACPFRVLREFLKSGRLATRSETSENRCMVLRRLLWIAAAILFQAAGTPAPAQSIRAEDLEAGKFLVASKDLGDPNFAQTVVLLV